MSSPTPVGAIDVHAHAVPEEVVAAVANGVDGVTLIKQDGVLRFRFDGNFVTAPIEPGLLDVDERLRHMDRQGVEMQLLSSFIDVSAHHAGPAGAAAYATLFNDAMAAVVERHPDRFRGFATVPTLLDDAGAAELTRAVDSLGFIGAELGAATVADDALLPLWEALDATQSTVLIHPEASTTATSPFFTGNFVGNPAESTMAAEQLMLSGRLEQFEQVQIFLVHGGGFLPYQLGRLAHGWSTYGTSFGAAMSADPRELARRFHYDTVLHDPAALRYLIDTVGVDRVVIGTDYPFAMGDDDPVATVRGQEQLSEEALDNVIRANADRAIRG